MRAIESEKERADVNFRTLGKKMVTAIKLVKLDSTTRGKNSFGIN